LVLIDLDGCLTFGDVADSAAARLLDMLAGRFVVLSNNSTDTPHSLSARLDRLGLRVAPDRIMRAGALMVDELAADGREVALFAAPQLADHAHASGLRISPEPEILAIARALTLTFDGLNTMLRHLYNGADLVVSNPDLTHPGEGRVPVVETGAL